MNTLLSVNNWKLVHYVYDGDKYKIMYGENDVYADISSLFAAIQILNTCLN